MVTKSFLTGMFGDKRYKQMIKIRSSLYIFKSYTIKLYLSRIIGY